MTSTLDIARWLRDERGFSVIPLDHPDSTEETDPKRIGKVPVTRWRAFQDAKPTDDNLRAWFSNGHPRNLGIVTGETSRIVAVDLDDAEAQAWATSHLPLTPMRTKTARGEQWFYRHPGVPVRNRARLRTGDVRLALDVRADGGYVVGPTSKHATGVVYQREGEWPPVEQLPVFDPAWLETERQATPKPIPAAVARHCSGDERDRVLHRARRYVDSVPPAVEGQGGDATTFQLCCRIVRGFDLGDADALDVLREWNARCSPPWREDELLKKIEGARKYGDESIGGMRDTPPPLQFRRPVASVPSPTSVSIDTKVDEVNSGTETRGFPLTDSGNAEYFAHHYGPRLRYDHRRGRYLVWDSVRWKPDADGEVRRLAKAAVRRRLTEAAAASDDIRERAIKHALTSENRSRLDALLYLAQSEHPIADDGTNWDADGWLLCTPTGVVDLRTGVLRAGHQDDRLTLSTGVGYYPDATCPRWERFIASVFGDDGELVDFVHRAVGYSLSGDTSMQALFLCYGIGGNGKGTLLNTLRIVFGDYGWNMPFSTIEMNQRSAIPNDLAALVNRRYVVASETNDGARLNEARVKALTGCDPVTARFLHGEYFEFEPVGKYWLATNHKPVVRDDSHGFWRRIRLIPFAQTFPVDPNLADVLRAEAPGILAWAVRGCLAWQSRGLEAPAKVVAATAEYQGDSDALRPFLDAACVIADGASVRASELFEHYKRWAEREGLSDRERLTSTAFGRKMSERFSRARCRGGRAYEGVEPVSTQ